MARSTSEFAGLFHGFRGAHGEAVRGEVRFHVGDGVLAEMKNARSQYGICTTNFDTVGQILQTANTTRSDYGYIHRIGYRTCQTQIKS